MTAAAEQLWLDVPRPLQPRVRRSMVSRQRKVDPSPAARQMELRVDPTDVPSPRAKSTLAPPPAAFAPAPPPTRCFVAWLADQGRRSDMIGELARAAKLDSGFPRRGAVDVVRTYLCRAGADGDAFIALEEAERAFDRLDAG